MGEVIDTFIEKCMARLPDSFLITVLEEWHEDKSCLNEDQVTVISQEYTDRGLGDDIPYWQED